MTSKKKSKKSSVRKNVEIAIGIDNEIESFNQSVLADLSDIFVIPRIIRLLALNSDKNTSESAEESFWNHTAKVIVFGIGGTAIAFGSGMLIPFGYVLKVVSGGSNTKLWLQRHPEFEKKLEKDETFKAKITDTIVDAINTVTITTNKHGGVGGRIESVVKQQ